ncbi:MAG: hypothetical protein GX220_01645 [Treponema sp.]|nr:hypothetical protein [Treponema sp.]
MKQIIDKKNKIFLFILIFIIYTPLFSVPFFNGSVGGSLNFFSDKTDFKPITTMNAFLAGQVDFSDSLVFRVGFNFDTENIFGDNFLKQAPALFNLDEVSFNYHGNMGALSHYVTAFLGSPEPIGSPLFFQRYFGVPDFSSKFLFTQKGSFSNEIYPISGIGANYMLKAKNLSGGIYFYYNKISVDENALQRLPKPNLGTPIDGSESDPGIQPSSADAVAANTSLNFDLRFTASGTSSHIDIGAGFSFPFDNADSSGEDVILIIRKANFHCGLNAFIGSTFMTNLTFQAGITHLEINPDEDEQVLALDDIYCFIEPRFVTKNLSFAFAMFNIPSEVSKQLYYIENPLGINVSIYSNNFAINNKKAEIGGHITISLPETKLDLDFSEIELQISPFFTLELGDGQFDAALKMNILNFTSFKNALMNIGFSVGYQVKI